MRRDSSFCAKPVRYNIFTNGAPYHTVLTLLLRSFAEKKVSVAAFQLTLPDSCDFLIKNIFWQNTQ